MERTRSMVIFVTAAVLAVGGLVSTVLGWPGSLWGSQSFYGERQLDSTTPISEPVFRPGRESDLHGQTLVIGLALNGDAKAYPVTILNHHEMVNDVVGGVPVLVTWCPICGTGLVHDRRINGVPHTFGNYSTLYRNAMTWFDHETKSLWSQPTGTALEGQYEGIRLNMLAAQVLPWATWMLLVAVTMNPRRAQRHPRLPPCRRLHPRPPLRRVRKLRP